MSEASERISGVQRGGLSLAGDLADLTVVLARLGAGQPAVQPTHAGLDAALHTRAAVLALSRQILADVHVTPTSRSPGFADLHAHPAAVMAWAVDHHPPATASQSPIDVARGARSGSSTALWEHAATLATRTHVRWQRAHLAEQSAPTVRNHPARPALIADVATTLTALTHGESAMATVASHLGDHTSAAALEAGLASPLRLAAEATCRSRPTDAPRWDVRLAADPRHLPVLPVHGLAGLPQGLARLAALLRGQSDVSPQHTALVISGQARIALALAARAPAVRPAGTPPLASVDDPSWTERLNGPLPLAAGPVVTRTGLLAYARALAGTWNHRDNALATLAPSDPRPLQQIGECLRAAQSAAPVPVPAHALLLMARGLDDALVATCAAVDTQLQRRSWLTATPSENAVGVALRWRPLNLHERPHAADALHSVRVARALPTHQPHRGRLITAAVALSPSPSRATRMTPAPAAHRPHR